MKLYNRIKNAVTASLVSIIYICSCINAQGKCNPGIVIGTIVMFGCVYLSIRAIDEHMKEKAKERRCRNV